MAIYGIGAYYDSDVTKQFVLNKVACIGWSEQQAPSIYRQVQQVQLGDLIYIKSFTPSDGLFIKAIGIITDNLIRKVPNDLGWGFEVNWIWSSHRKNEEVINPGRLEDRHDNIRGGTFYQEYNTDVSDFVIQTVIKGEPPEDYWA